MGALKSHLSPKITKRNHQAFLEQHLQVCQRFWSFPFSADLIWMSVWVISVGKPGLTKLLFVAGKYYMSLSLVLKWKCRYRPPESPKIPSDTHALAGGMQGSGAPAAPAGQSWLSTVPQMPLELDVEAAKSQLWHGMDAPAKLIRLGERAGL